MDIKDRVLVVEDDKSIRNFFRTVLEANNYDVIMADTGTEAYSLITSRCPDVVLLDLGLPDMDGMKILKSVREWSGMPIIVVSARTHERDKVEALDLGADDYLPKPFVMGELLARVRAMLRRREEFTPDILTCRDVSLNRSSYELSANGKSVVLPKMEYQLMEVLMLNQGIFLSSEELLVKVWGYDTEAEIGTVWVYISYLRKRLAAFHTQVTIKAKRSIGYTLDAGT